jgi:gamma-glutamyltranspeptidase/glutathione hydrolase
MSALPLRLALILAGASAPAVAAPDGATVFHPVHARHGMVVSEQALASRIGADVLRRGGNAVDAAVATGFALAVVLPYAGNLGGGGFMLRHDAACACQNALDFRETAPAALSSAALARAGADVRHSPLAVGVPGTVAGLDYALRHWGTLTLAEAIAPAAHLAERGFPVSEQLAWRLVQERAVLARHAASRAIFFRAGRPLRAGETLRQSDLARTLRRIAADGAPAFYQGPVGRRIVATLARHGGVLSRADLARYRPLVREPLRGHYRGYDIVAVPPPSSGGIHVVQILNLLERHAPATEGAYSAQNLHYLIEASKLAFADRERYVADPDYTAVPVAALISRDYADAQAARIDPRRAAPAERVPPGATAPYESAQTTHYSVVDAAGNAVAVTYTLNENFGSGIVAAGTGILLNDEMVSFDAGTDTANALRPGKRPLSSMAPTLVLKNAAPWLVTGSPGSERIISVVAQPLVDIIDYGMNPAEAAATPRVHAARDSGELWVERGMSADSLRLLRGLGHRLAPAPAMGRTQTLLRRGDGWEGASDPRNPDGAAIGY